YALWWPARRGADGGRHGPLSMASCLFQSANRGSATGTGAESGAVLGGGAARRPHLCDATKRTRAARDHANTVATQVSRAAGGGHYRSRSGGARGSRNVAQGRVRRRDHRGGRRSGRPVRPPESVEGLSGRERTGGMDSTSAA